MCCDAVVKVFQNDLVGYSSLEVLHLIWYYPIHVAIYLKGRKTIDKNDQAKRLQHQTTGAMY